LETTLARNILLPWSNSSKKNGLKAQKAAAEFQKQKNGTFSKYLYFAPLGLLIPGNHIS